MTGYREDFQALRRLSWFLSGLNLFDDGFRVNDAARDRKEGVSGEKIVDLSGRLPALGDGPDHERLAAAAVAGSEDAPNRRRELSGLGLDVAARILGHIDAIQDLGLGSEESHGQKDQLARVDLLGVGNFLDLPTSGLILRPLDLSNGEFLILLLFPP